MEKRFNKLRKANPKVTSKECNSFRIEMNFRGHVISRESTAADTEKLNIVKE